MLNQQVLSNKRKDKYSYIYQPSKMKPSSNDPIVVAKPKKKIKSPPNPEKTFYNRLDA